METGGDGNRILSEINVTPLVDVMLVLLIIFMVAAPMMIQGMDVKLPKTTAKPIRSEEQNIIVTIDRDERIFINNVRIPKPHLRKSLEGLRDMAEGREVLLRADRAVPYGFVVEVLAQMKELGIEKLGMVTEPLEEKRWALP